ncbi:major vault protein [Acipenser ruthenus]|uniref:major vault protein n=1 Tax=Acipenser ruthenus TaxID=7906 RepID=UPI0027415B32|nr:major vault protein [Acipenser ruthenus]XP_058868236.1 major vault protein [Acipenser ruthenus]
MAPPMFPQKMPGESIIRIPPHHYIHVLDQNTNIARVETGPKTYIRQDNERVLFAPMKMTMVPPRHYCVIQNPVLRDADGRIEFDQLGQAKLRHADLEIRLAQEPFPLYPGEELQQDLTPLQVVFPNTALRLQALLDFEDDQGDKRVAGDEWLFEGPGTYIPRKEVEVVETIRATVIRHNQAIRLRARKEGRDRGGVERVTGEEWLVRKVGAYLPGVHEEVIDIVDAFVLTDKKALHVRAVRPFRDAGGVDRRTGEEWLITHSQREAHIPDVSEEVVGVVEVTTLGSRQYCVILDPVGRDGKPQLGQKRVVKGEKSFFLQPGECLENGIQDVFILSEQEGLVLRAVEAFTEAQGQVERGEEEEEEEEGEGGAGGVSRRPGDRWMLRGPLEYVPPVEVEVQLRRQAIPLDENEGIYVRDIKSGKVRAVIGQTYMLTQDEELWEKVLPPNVEALLATARDPLADRSDRESGSKGRVERNRTMVVSYRVPHNAAVQVYDYREKKARVVFGPELVMLGPDEQFTVISLSGDKPKRSNVIKSICLLLGPDFCTDIINIETADHARLQLQLSYNWHFDLKDKSNPAEGFRIFSVPDFIGDSCKAIASRIRGAVASVQFDDFHKNSNRIICSAVFGFDGEMKVRDSFRFPQNNLMITSVDIQSVEPVDQRTRDSLQKSVQLAIEITTNSQEATARHEAERLEQEARGRLERQRITDQSQAERARKELLELEALSAAVESTGAAKAEAQSKSEAAKIEGEAAVLQARLKAEALQIEAEAELTRLSKAREQELVYQREQNKLEMERATRLGEIETKKFQDLVQSIGADTIRAIAVSGPELQVKLLKGLGLQSTLITDGSSPINLFTTANGLLGALPKPREKGEAE